MMPQKILVTGGAGYIGSHTCIELLQTGYSVVVVDNLSNSSKEALKRVESITGKSLVFYQADIRDKSSLEQIFTDHNIDSVIHFAGLKAVGESVEQPLRYYDNNITGSLELFKCMDKHSVKKVVFSSSATVYGEPHTLPIKEHFPLSATNPYGRSKLMVEEILSDFYQADTHWKVALLRYFNPVGAHHSGRIGEDPLDIPNNLMPFVSKVAIGEYQYLSVFGNDYSTPDGTGVRDYIHVVDLAKGHLKAIQAFDQAHVPNFLTVNLGTGKGYSVLEMVKAFEQASGKKVRYQVVERRAGDIACCYADPGYAKEILGWQAEKGLDDMCQDSWRWQSNNPEGYCT